MTFETNSSSTHSITICPQETYEKWCDGRLLFGDWNKDFLEAEELTSYDYEEAKAKYESSHLKKIDKIKYELTYFYNKDICDYCDCSYYVYGVERACEHKDCHHANNYKDFVPTEPLHDKSRYGV